MLDIGSTVSDRRDRLALITGGHAEPLLAVTGDRRIVSGVVGRQVRSLRAPRER